jgi:hypothetical protein
LRRKSCILFESRFSQANQRQAFYSAGPDNHERAQNNPADCKTEFGALIQVGGAIHNTSAQNENPAPVSAARGLIECVSVTLTRRRLATGAPHIPRKEEGCLFDSELARAGQDQSASPDADAIATKIGDLYRAAREALGNAPAVNEGTVTDTRHFPEKILPSRNAGGSKDPIPPGHSCADCESPFSTGQVRYPILTDRLFRYGKKFHYQQIPVSVCKDCFDRRLHS